MWWDHPTQGSHLPLRLLQGELGVGERKLDLDCPGSNTTPSSGSGQTVARSGLARTVPALSPLGTVQPAHSLTLPVPVSSHCADVHTPTWVTSMWLAQLGSCYLTSGLPGPASLTTSALQQVFGQVAPLARGTLYQLARDLPLPTSPFLSLCSFSLGHVPRGSTGEREPSMFARGTRNRVQRASGEHG